MSAHLALNAASVRAARPTVAGAIALPGRRVLRGGDFRVAIRTLLSAPAGRHRVTFIPLDKYGSLSD